MKKVITKVLTIDEFKGAVLSSDIKSVNILSVSGRVYDFITVDNRVYRASLPDNVDDGDIKLSLFLTSIYHLPVLESVCVVKYSDLIRGIIRDALTLHGDKVYCYGVDNPCLLSLSF